MSVSGTLIRDKGDESKCRYQEDGDVEGPEAQFWPFLAGRRRIRVSLSHCPGMIFEISNKTPELQILKTGRKKPRSQEVGKQAELDGESRVEDGCVALWLGWPAKQFQVLLRRCVGC